MTTGTMNRNASLATLFVVCLLFFIDIANLGMANIALPTLQKSLGFNSGTLQWVLTAYSLSFGGFLMVGGRLGDIFGQRSMLILGTSLFNVSTLVCALVNNDIGLVVGRAFQGLGAAFTIPAAQSLVALSFDDERARIRAFAVWGACGSTGFVLGPILGGLFTSLTSWQWIFWFSLIVEGALEIVALGLLVTHQLPAAASSPKPEGTDAPRSIVERVDILGSSVSIAGLILLVFALSEGNVVGWDTVEVIVTLILAIVLIFVFVFIELKVARYPILPKYFWADRIRMLGCIAAALTYAVWQGTNYLLTLQLQGLGFSALSTAVRFLPLGVTAIVVNVVAPIIVKFVNPRPILIVGWVLGLVGVLLLSFIKSQNDYWRFCLPGEILYIAGIGTVNFVGNITVVATAKKEFQGTVSGIFNMFLNVGGAVLGVALLTAISNAVTNAQGGSRNAQAALHGYQAGYYTMVGMAGVGVFVALFYKVKEQDIKQEQNVEHKRNRDISEENKEGAEARTESVATDQQQLQSTSDGALESEG